MIDPSATEFASPGRESPERLLEQSRLLLEKELVLEFMASIPAALMLLNQHRQIVAINERCREFLNVEGLEACRGLRPGEALGCEAAGSVNGCGTTRQCRVCGAVLAILASMRHEQPVLEECLFRHEDGSCAEFQVEASTLHVGGERFTVFVLLDISAQKRKELLDRVFFHDINNALWGLKLTHEVVAQPSPQGVAPQGAPPQGTLPQGASALQSQLVDRVIREFQMYRRMVAAENKELQVEPRVLDRHQLVRALGDQFAVVLERRGMTLEAASEGSGARLFSSDEGLLMMVLENLMKNAVEASQSGEVVRLRATASEEQVCFSVWNRSAMPEDVQLQMFKRSFSTKGQGRGVGTYSVKLLTEGYLGGQVAFTSSPEKGTSFVVTLPKNGPVV
jgi:signal transduction histidine kinase